MNTHQQRPPRARRLRPIAAFLVIGVLLATACVYPTPLWYDQQLIKLDTDSYLQDVAKGDGHDAYGMLASSLRSRCVEESFDALVQSAQDETGSYAGSSPSKEHLQDVQVTGDKAEAKLIVPDSDPLTFDYEKEDGRWYILPPGLDC